MTDSSDRRRRRPEGYREAPRAERPPSFGAIATGIGSMLIIALTVSLAIDLALRLAGR